MPPPPVLASEALKDELAPIEPLRSAARVWCGAAAVWFGLMGFAPLWHPQGKPAFELGTAVAALAVCAAPLRYGQRAAGMLVVAVVAGLLGVLGLGPASVTAYAVSEWGLLHLIAAAAVPAALVFRSRYRAYAGARAILAAALALALPLATYSALGIDDAPLGVQITCGVTLLALGASLLGFMGSQTSVGGDYLAALLIVAVTAEIAALGAARLPGLVESGSAAEWVSMLGSAVSFGVAAALGAVGLFQVLAMRNWDRAREVNVHPKMSEPPAGPPSQPSLSDTWSSRG
jgi:hypothetical protein